MPIVTHRYFILSTVTIILTSVMGFSVATIQYYKQNQKPFLSKSTYLNAVVGVTLAVCNVFGFWLFRKNLDLLLYFTQVHVVWGVTCTSMVINDLRSADNPPKLLNWAVGLLVTYCILFVAVWVLVVKQRSEERRLIRAGAQPTTIRFVDVNKVADAVDYTVVNIYGSGKSGDTVMKVKDGSDKTYTLKYGSINRTNDLIQERSNTINVRAIIGDSAVQVFNEGMVNVNDGQMYFGYLMEDLSENYTTLDSIILEACKQKSLPENIPTIFTNLFYVIVWLKTNDINGKKYSHCDLHPQNIFVKTNGDNLNSIKIIDWNMYTDKDCRGGRERKLSGVILNEYLRCKPTRWVRQLKSLVVQEAFAVDADSDLYMFIKTLGVLYSVQAKREQFNRLKELAVQVKTGNDVKKALNNFGITLKRILSKLSF